MRTYTDGAGTTWRVWAVFPSLPMTPSDRRDPWLCFESATAKHRLRPLPAEWESRSDTELDVMRRATESVAPAVQPRPQG